MPKVACWEWECVDICVYILAFWTENWVLLLFMDAGFSILCTPPPNPNPRSLNLAVFIIGWEKQMISHLTEITTLGLFQPSSWKTRTAPSNCYWRNNVTNNRSLRYQTCFTIFVKERAFYLKKKRLQTFNMYLACYCNYNNRFALN